MSRRQIATAVTSGQLIRVRRGIYATERLASGVASAVRQGGVVSCISALSIHGVWTPPTPLHVRLPADASAPAPGPAVVHRDGRSPGATAIDEPLTALRIAVRCVDDLTAVALIDSALHQHVVRLDDVISLLSGTRRGRRLISRVDQRAESGIESMARVRLRAQRIRLRTQVVIAGIGRVDILVGERLVIELDGEQWHDRESTFESDRARDSALTVRGYLALRYSYRRVMFDWDAVEQEILTLVRQRKHRAAERARAAMAD